MRIDNRSLDEVPDADLVGLLASWGYPHFDPRNGVVHLRKPVRVPHEVVALRVTVPQLRDFVGVTATVDDLRHFVENEFEPNAQP